MATPKEVWNTWILMRRKAGWDGRSTWSCSGQSTPHSWVSMLCLVVLSVVLGQSTVSCSAPWQLSSICTRMLHNYAKQNVISSQNLMKTLKYQLVCSCLLIIPYCLVLFRVWVWQPLLVGSTWLRFVPAVSLAHEDFHLCYLQVSIRRNRCDWKSGPPTNTSVTCLGMGLVIVAILFV